MKLLLLADCNSSHTVKWVSSLRKHGYTIQLFSLYPPDNTLYESIPDILVSSINLHEELKFGDDSKISKLVYLKAVRKIRRLIKEFEPDILHAHYASSYGLLGALSEFHPFVLSVWGSDIYNFPNHSLLHRMIIKFNLYKADRILSTSNVMIEEIKKYTSKQVVLTTFGINIDRFKSMDTHGPFNCTDIVIGTIKTLEIQYGIEYLIRAFKIVNDKFPKKSLKSLILW